MTATTKCAQPGDTVAYTAAFLDSIFDRVVAPQDFVDGASARRGEVISVMEGKPIVLRILWDDERDIQSVLARNVTRPAGLAWTDPDFRQEVRR